MKCSGWILTATTAAFLFAPGLAEARDTNRARASMVRAVKPGAAQLRNQRHTQGISSYRGKAMVKRLVKKGHVRNARLVLKSMNKRPNRKGLKGTMDRYRKWSAKRSITKKERQIKIDKFLSKKHAPIPLYLYPMP